MMTSGAGSQAKRGRRSGAGESGRLVCERERVSSHRAGWETLPQNVQKRVKPRGLRVGSHVWVGRERQFLDRHGHE